MSSLFSSKFIVTLKTLNQEELGAYEKWLRSPWCNSNKNLIKLFEKLRKYHPDFDNPRLDKEKLFRQILPDGKYSVRRMNNLLSEAYLTTERFLVFQNLSKNTQLQKELLLDAFEDRQLDDWFFKTSDKVIEHLEQTPRKDWADHLELLKLHRQVYHHPKQNQRMKPGALTIVRMGEHADLAYLLERAAIINEKIFRNRILKNEQHDISTELNKWLAVAEGMDHLSITFYKMRFAYTEENRLEQYKVLRRMFLEKHEALSENEQKIHFNSLMNDSVVFVRAGVFEITETLPLYKLGLKSGLLMHEGLLPYTRFAISVAVSNTKNDFEFTRHIISHYIEKLEKGVQTDALHWARAHTAYYQAEYDLCLDLLLSHDFKNKYFLQITKMLTTQVYFDLYLNDDSYHLFLFNYFDTFEKWVLREKFSSDKVKKSYLRFIQVSRYLAKVFADVNFKEGKITKLLKQETNIQGMQWLQKKIDAIIQLKSKRPSKD